MAVGYHVSDSLAPDETTKVIYSVFTDPTKTLPIIAQFQICLEVYMNRLPVLPYTVCSCYIEF